MIGDNMDIARDSLGVCSNVAYDGKVRGDMKKIHWWCRLLFGLGLMLCLCSRGAEAADKGSQFRERLIQGYKDYVKSVDVKSIGLSVKSSSDKKVIDQVIEDVLNETTDLFYAGREFSVSADRSTGKIIKVNLAYDKRYLSGSKVNVSKIKKVRRQLNDEIASIMKIVRPGMSDVEKALVLHDYLARTVVYTDSSSAPWRISEEGAILKKRANCMGYALGYIVLLEKAGIEAKCVSSESMAHMWNLVKVGGKWYHVDLVWDAPLSSLNRKNMYGYVCHDNFLVSNAAIRKTGHKGFSASATSTKYDKKYWRKSDSSFWYQGGKYYYATNTGIYVRKRIASGTARRIKKGRILCFVRRKGYKFYCIAGNQAYRVDVKTRKWKAVYRPPGGTRLEQLKCSGKKIYFRYTKGRKMFSGSRKI